MFFLDYDYIGSPWLVKDWSINDFDFPESLRGERVVGNGGFCIRSKKFLKLSSEFFNQGLILRSHPEDIAVSVWYRSLFEKNGIKFAPSKIAQRFAFEGGDDKYSNQFGFHGFYTDLDQWFIENPHFDSIHRNYLEYKGKERVPWKPSK